MNTFLKISLRHLWQSRLYSLINIFGLATGITCMLFAVLYLNDEHSFDSFHVNNPNLYRITTTMVEGKGDQSQTTGSTGQVQGPAFAAAVPELKSYVRVFGGDVYGDVIANNKTIHIQPLFVDPNFFDVFSFHLLRGDPAKVLSDLNSAVITESTAKKLFNSIDVVGRLMKVDADPSYEKLGKPLIVSGVVKDPPANSSLQFDALFTFKFLQLSFDDKNWLNAYLGTFVVLNANADTNVVTQKFNAVYARHAKEQLSLNFKTYGYDPQVSYGLQHINDVHLNPLMHTTGNIEYGIINGGNPVYSYIFMGIAVFILLMAAINFINISIANSLKRAKEVGVRKIAGSSRLQIIFQFLTESAVLCIVSFLLSLSIINTALPLFNNLTDKRIYLSEAFSATLLLYFILLLSVIILMTGFYPAFVLSRFKASEVFYKKQKLSGHNSFGRSLVIVQFSLAVFLLIATLVYYGQMKYIRTKDLGYNPSQVIRLGVSGDRDYRSVTGYLKSEFAKEPSLETVSFGNDGYDIDVRANDHNFKAWYKNIDENFLTALQVPLKAGRNFSASFSTDKKNAAIVNEAFIKAANIQDPFSTTIMTNAGDSTTKIIIGVVKDFHFGSLREPIAPMVMYMSEVPDGGIWIRFDKTKQREILATIEKIYKAALPSAVFQYSFLDELNAKQYSQEKRWQQVVTIAAILSFVICCLGLFGLAHLATHQRIKEIGIRKVLGASVTQIVYLLSGDFLKLVVVAFMIAAPLSWLAMNTWLQNFAYRISIGAGIFLLAAAIAMIIALSAISLQAIKAAIANPVSSLRTE